jgi:hypothetical protein
MFKGFPLNLKKSITASLGKPLSKRIDMLIRGR